MALTIFNHCVEYMISKLVIWIPREQNQQEDLLSRILDVDDWGV